MRKTMDNTDQSGSGNQDSPGRAIPSPRRNRSAAAGRELLRAVGRDLVTLATVLARSARFFAVKFARKVLRRPARRSWAQVFLRATRASRALVVVCIFGMLGFSGAMAWALRGLSLDHLAVQPDKFGLLLEAANGEPLGRVGSLRVADVSLRDFSASLINAVLSIEDRRFYEHIGVDPLGVLRAARANMAAGGIVEGGSTITQQLVKLQYLNNDRTYYRKLREALVATWLEARLSKNEILTRYLNNIYMGAGAYGVPAAARLYFDKRPADLSLAEAAMLAGMIQAPSQFNPLHHLKAAQARAARVLDAMVANGMIEADAANLAKTQPATVRSTPQLAPASSWFANWAAQQAADGAGPDAGLTHARTTLQLSLQRLAQEIIDETLATNGRRQRASQAALVAMRPDGAVVAMVGGRDYQASQFNRAVDAIRQPGSLFKLFDYLAALRAGYSPEDTIDARPIDVNGWEPENFGNEHYGSLTLADAFAHSVNTAAVRLAMKVGLPRVIAAARDLGIDRPLPPVPSLALGAVGVNLLEMTAAFASVRADRMHLRPWGIAASGPDSKQMWPARTLPASAQTLGPYDQPLIKLLQGVIAHGTGRAAALNGFAAGKTGTSQDYRDAWFIGFDQSLVVGVWVGNDNNAPMNRVVGGGLPAQIWKRFITEANSLVAPEDLAEAQTQASSLANAPRPEGLDTPRESESAPGSCEYKACASAYQSFRTSDCSYRAFSGERRYCAMMGKDKLLPPPLTQRTATNSPAHCDVDACSRHYQSFDASDCTYQPYDGGARQLCVK
jgi:1A family penicillin-binding protein